MRRTPSTVASLAIICLILFVVNTTVAINDDFFNKTTSNSRPEWCSATRNNDKNNIFDYIVVGSGPGGGVVASRLALAGYNTLLLEAGPDYNTEKTKTPYFWPLSSEESQVEWRLRASTSAIDPGRDNVLYPRASMIGGCAMHNAMIALYPFPNFFNNLQSLTGDKEFAEEKMRQRFEQLEKNQYCEDDNILSNGGHGFLGYLATSLPDIRLLIGPKFLDKQLISITIAIILNQTKAIREFFGFFRNIFNFPYCLPSFILDVNAPGFNNKEGVHLVPQAIDKNNGYTRSSVYNFIKETSTKTNKLTIRTNSFVTKILLQENSNGGKPIAIGVQVQEGTALYEASSGTRTMGNQRTYYARKEVIISGGAFNTPQMLMLSGIGPSDQLNNFGIKTIVDLPGVGSNLRDKLEATMNYRASKDWRVYAQGCTNGAPTPEEDPCYLEYIKGIFPNVYTSGGSIIAIQKKTKQDFPDMYIQLGINSFRGYEDGWVDEAFYEGLENVLIINFSTTRFGPSTGTVRIQSSNPFDVVEIDVNGYDDEDLERSAKELQQVRELMKKLQKRGLISKETHPGDSVDSFESLKSWVRANGWGHHPVGTAKIGSDDDPMAVVDGQFRVRGVKNLRVVDASVFPDQPGFFPLVPIYMIAEKASQDIIKADLYIKSEEVGC